MNTTLTVYVADMGGQGDFGSISCASHLGSAGLKVIIFLAVSPFGEYDSGWIAEIHKFVSKHILILHFPTKCNLVILIDTSYELQWCEKVFAPS